MYVSLSEKMGGAGGYTDLIKVLLVTCLLVLGVLGRLRTLDYVATVKMWSLCVCVYGCVCVCVCIIIFYRCPYLLWKPEEFMYVYYTSVLMPVGGPGSSVGIATDYGLDGPGSNPGGTRFSAHPDRPWGPPSLL